MSSFSNFKNKLLRTPSQRAEKEKARGGSNPFTGGQPSDAPPPYTPKTAQVPVTLGGQSSRGGQSSHGVHDNDAYANLANFDTVLLIDDSGSMSAGNLWPEAEAALQAISGLVTQYDQDGIDIYFLNHKSGSAPPPDKSYMARDGYYGINSTNSVANIFRRVYPSYSTPTGMRLEQILTPYVRHLRDAESTKPLNLIVITDGAPSDNPMQAITTAANNLDRLMAPSYQVGIQFVQIGNDRGATRALQELDDEIQSLGVRDMVDTITCNWGKSLDLTSSELLKTVLGAVDRRLDNQNSGGSKKR